MEWVDEAIVLGARRHGEEHVILELMTRARGRHLGMVRRGASPSVRPIIQSGNTVQATWRARIESQMGSYNVETRQSRVALLMDQATALNGMNLLAEHMRLLPEREPHPELYECLCALLDVLDQPLLAASLMVRFELMLLEELGFGLDLHRCAATGRQDQLTHVSPKSGRAVCLDVALPYAPRLFVLPPFLGGAQMEANSLTHDERNSVSLPDLAHGMRLTGYFLSRHVWEPRGHAEPLARNSFFVTANKKA